MEMVSARADSGMQCVGGGITIYCQLLLVSAVVLNGPTYRQVWFYRCKYILPVAAVARIFILFVCLFVLGLINLFAHP